MNLREKLSLLVGAGVSRRVPGAAGETRSVERVGLPGIILSDGPAGLHIRPLRFGVKGEFYATAFPNEVLLASTWNTKIVEEVGRAIGEEARDYDVDVLLAPGVNIHRAPIGGRMFEYFSEDPILAGEMASAYVAGVQSVGVGATPKHLVANDQEINRTRVNIVVSERALREIYLRPFEIAVRKARPWALMGAYNKLNGSYCVQNSWLLTKVLREDWGFDGVLMTDWGAGDNPVEQIKAGTDLIMPGSDEVLERLVKAAESGELAEDVIDERARRVAELVMRSLKGKGFKAPNSTNLEGHAKIALEAAVEGMVLLKNNEALPVKPPAKIALFGKGSYWTLRGGSGSGYSNPRYVVSVADGLRERGFQIDGEVENIYRTTIHRFSKPIERYRDAGAKAIKNADQNSIQSMLTDWIDQIFDWLFAMHIQEDMFTEEFLDDVAERNDLAIITISRVSGEGSDRIPAKGDLYLRDDEYSLIRRVSDAFHRRGKKVVVLLNVPGPIEVVSWRDFVDAILVIWMPGQEGGRAVAGIIAGDFSPSGKLPMTWPRDIYEVPAMRTYPRDYAPPEIVYLEDIYVGYRYYDTFSVEPAYEFGYGLSYTRFDYSDLGIQLGDDRVVVRLRVKNIGQYPGKEVVQVYFRALSSRFNRPFQELKGFAKTRLLNPGESEDVSIEIPITYLAIFGGVWIVEKGPYEVRIGRSSRDIALTEKIELGRDRCYDTKWRETACPT
jgi:beta-glucosidase